MLEGTGGKLIISWKINFAPEFLCARNFNHGTPEGASRFCGCPGRDTDARAWGECLPNFFLLLSRPFSVFNCSPPPPFAWIIIPFSFNYPAGEGGREAASEEGAFPKYSKVNSEGTSTFSPEARHISRQDLRAPLPPPPRSPGVSAECKRIDNLFLSYSQDKLHVKIILTLSRPRLRRGLTGIDRASNSIIFPILFSIFPSNSGESYSFCWLAVSTRCSTYCDI